MALVTIDACQGCGACLLTCPTHAIRPVAGGLTVRADRCTGCLECLEICPVDAIRVVADPDAIRVVEPDSAEGAR
ncbi:electron transporter RnfB [Micromonospora ureilytica]|uniref:Electron transporter RnfB n=2 Tax=Micromonospora TaxID=1873 RepID=A0A3N9Y2R3_9ACTN|nr:4Fe-4S binding protein [Micromonospora ureilytica]RQX19455.1 electron transporter RnfB [Micromonospora ureilytica]